MKKHVQKAAEEIVVLRDDNNYSKDHSHQHENQHVLRRWRGR
jgi:hypothetical protein